MNNELDSAEKIEAALWLQEHRIIQIAYNFFVKRPELEKDDPRKQAAARAFIFWFFSPGTIVTTGIGITAIIGLFVAYQANNLVQEQNNTLIAQTDLLRTQNERLLHQNQLIVEQNVLQESARRSALIFELSSILDEIDEELDAAHIEIDAIKTRGIKDEAGSQEIKGRLRRRDIDNQSLYRLSARLTGRIVALSRSLRPYRFLDDKGSLLDKALSPERAQLLLSLMDSGIDMEEINHSAVTFNKADLREAELSEFDFTHINLGQANLSGSNGSGVIFHYAKLEGSNFSNTNFGSAKFNWSNLKKVDFSNANLAYADFDGADIENANFENSILKGGNFNSVSNWENIVIKGANIKDIKNPPPKFVDWALLNGAIEE